MATPMLAEQPSRPVQTSRSTEPAGSPNPAAEGLLRGLGTGVLYTLVSVVLLGLIYPLLMTALAGALFPRQANGSIVTLNGAPVGVIDRRPTLGQAAVFSRPSLRRRQERLRPDLDERHEPRPDLEEADRRDRRRRRSAAEGEPRREGTRSGGSRHVERERHRPRYQP